MKIIHFWILSVSVVYGIQEPLRLIATSSDTSEWMSQEQVLALIQSKTHFMDITDADLEPFTFVPKIPRGTHFMLNKRISHGTATRKRNHWALGQFIHGSFHTRYYKSRSGKAASEWIYATATELARKSSSKVTVQKFAHPWDQFSVIARFDPEKTAPSLLNQQEYSTTKTSDQELPIVIIGSHIDSVNQWNPYFGRAPGADDDGSGTTTLFEVYRVLLESGFVPSRPVEFHWYSAEEGGLLGSQKIAAAYAQQGIPVLSMYQVDMTGYVPPNKSPIIGVATDNVSAPLAQFIKMLVGAYCAIDAADVQCGYGCSDHFSWHKVGVDAIFTFESSFADHSPFIHTSYVRLRRIADSIDREDLITHIDFEHVREFAKLVLSYVMELGLS